MAVNETVSWILWGVGMAAGFGGITLTGASPIHGRRQWRRWGTGVCGTAKCSGSNMWAGWQEYSELRRIRRGGRWGAWRRLWPARSAA